MEVLSNFTMTKTRLVVVTKLSISKCAKMEKMKDSTVYKEERKFCINEAESIIKQWQILRLDLIAKFGDFLFHLPTSDTILPTVSETSEYLWAVWMLGKRLMESTQKGLTKIETTIKYLDRRDIAKATEE